MNDLQHTLRGIFDFVGTFLFLTGGFYVVLTLAAIDQNVKRIRQILERK